MNATMNWKPHYTGIEIAEAGPLYMQRDAKSKRLQFVRVSGYHWMLGAFIGRTNHCGGVRGCEVFTSGIHAGWITHDAKYVTRRAVIWSGSSVDPHSAYSIRIGRFFIGSTTDKWLKRIVARRAQRKWDQMAEQA